MSAQALLTIDGKCYMSTKAAAGKWNLQPKTVANYCKTDKIKNKFKNGRYGWYIRIDEIKPLSQYEIRKILILTLSLKNNPTYEIDWTPFQYDDSVIEKIYDYLHVNGYIQKFLIKDKKRIPYDVVLTPKGMELVTTIQKEEKSLKSNKILMDWLPIIINIAQLYLQTKSSI